MGKDWKMVSARDSLPEIDSNLINAQERNSYGGWHQKSWIPRRLRQEYPIWKIAWTVRFFAPKADLFRDQCPSIESLRSWGCCVLRHYFWYSGFLVEISVLRCRFSFILGKDYQIAESQTAPSALHTSFRLSLYNLARRCSAVVQDGLSPSGDGALIGKL